MSGFATYPGCTLPLAPEAPADPCDPSEDKADKQNKWMDVEFQAIST